MKYLIPLLLIFACRASTIPGGPAAPTGPTGPQCKAVTTCDVESQLATLFANGLPGQVGPKGDVGAPGQAGAAGTPGAKGDKGDTGARGATGTQGQQGFVGPPGAPGTTLGNTIVLTAARTYAPVTDYKGQVTLAATFFLPPTLKLIEGDQDNGFAYLDFGTLRCAYKGNRRNDSRAGYDFVGCQGQPTLKPGKPFAFTGTLTFSIGAGASDCQTTQAIAFLQFQ